MVNDLIQTYGAVDEKQIRVDIPTFAFVEEKRHWWHRSRITGFRLTQSTFEDFHTHMLTGGYTCYIEETKSGGILTKKTITYEMVFEK